MPTSNIQNVPKIIELVQMVNPKSVLDIGSGYGKYGHLIREYCDDFNREMRIDAVEVFPQYLGKTMTKPYDRIFVEDFREFDTRERHYDLVLMIDVIEHFSKFDALAVLDRAFEMADYVLVSTPLGFYHQGAAHGNVHETHLSGWNRNDLPGDDYSTDDTVIKVIRKSDWKKRRNS